MHDVSVRVARDGGVERGRRAATVRHRHCGGGGVHRWIGSTADLRVHLPLIGPVRRPVLVPVVVGLNPDRPAAFVSQRHVLRAEEAGRGPAAAGWVRHLCAAHRDLEPELLRGIVVADQSVAVALQLDNVVRRARRERAGVRLSGAERGVGARQVHRRTRFDVQLVPLDGGVLDSVEAASAAGVLLEVDHGRRRLRNGRWMVALRAKDGLGRWQQRHEHGGGEHRRNWNSRKPRRRLDGVTRRVTPFRHDERLHHLDDAEQHLGGVDGRTGYGFQPRRINGVEPRQRSLVGKPWRCQRLHPGKHGVGVYRSCRDRLYPRWRLYGVKGRVILLSDSNRLPWRVQQPYRHLVAVGRRGRDGLEPRRLNSARIQADPFGHQALLIEIRDGL